MIARLRASLKPVISYLLVGILGSLLLVFLKLEFEESDMGRRGEVLAYDILQWQLPSFSPKELPVVVVDISAKPVGEEATPRDFIRRLVEAIAKNKKGKPIAIAVDIDFSPSEDGWITPADPVFFDSCLKIRGDTGVPVFLGMYRTKAEPPDTWLGLPKYADLAAMIAIHKDDQRRVPIWIHANRSSERLRALSLALAEKYPKPLPKPSKLLIPFIKGNDNADAQYFADPQSGFAYSDLPVNYSKFEQIYHERLATISPNSVDEFSDRFVNKLVIIGDPKSPDDQVPIPGTNEVIGGVFVHASATYTLVEQPLYEFRKWVRFALDFLISILVVIGVGHSRFLHPDRPDVWRERQTKSIVMAMLLVVIAGIAFFRITHVLWLDFTLVLFALLLHPAVESSIHALCRRVARVWHRVFQREAGGQQ